MLLSLFLLAAAAPPAPAIGALDARITTAVSATIQRQHPVGAAVGVAKDGTFIFTKTYGVRDLTTNAPVDRRTRFEIGSVTKQFTAAAILQLREAGKLRIDDSLAKYFPALPHARELTLRELLNQISGLPDYLEHTRSTSAFSKPLTLRQVAAMVTKLDFTPGTRWEYSNTNYWLLGKVVAMVSGDSYEHYLRKHLFAPAGMTRSGFMQDEASYHDFAKGYWRGENGTGKLAVAPVIPEAWAGGAGAIVSTLGDLLKWDTALTSGKIVSAADYALMSSPGVLKDGDKTTYGMGLGLDPLLGHERVWHNGGSLGSFTMNGTYPKDHLDIIVFENSTAGDPATVERAALGAIFPADLAASEAASKRPARGEDLAFRPQILHYLDETLKGTVPPSEMSPEFAHVATPAMQKHIAKAFAKLGDPTSVIFRGKQTHGDDVMYRYRVEFAKGAIIFVVVYNPKTKIVDGIGLRPVQ